MFPYSGLRHRNTLWFVKTMVTNSSCFCNGKIEKQTAEWTQYWSPVPLIFYHLWGERTLLQRRACGAEAARPRLSHGLWAQHPLQQHQQLEAKLAQSHPQQTRRAFVWADRMDNGSVHTCSLVLLLTVYAQLETLNTWGNSQNSTPWSFQTCIDLCLFWKLSVIARWPAWRNLQRFRKKTMQRNCSLHFLHVCQLPWLIFFCT